MGNRRRTKARGSLTTLASSTMSAEQGDDRVLLENAVEDSIKSDDEFIGTNQENDANFPKENENQVEDGINAVNHENDAAPPRESKTCMEEHIKSVNQENDAFLPKENENQVADDTSRVNLPKENENHVEEDVKAMNHENDADFPKENENEVEDDRKVVNLENSAEPIMENENEAEEDIKAVNHENYAEPPKENENHVEDDIKAVNPENGADPPKENENHVEDATKLEKELACINQKNHADLAKGNGLYDINPCSAATNDQLLNLVVELTLQTEYLKSHFEDLKIFQSDSGSPCEQKRVIQQDGGAYEDVEALHGKIDSLNRELLEERQTRGAAEKALEHLRAVYSEADANAQELSAKLAEAQQKMDQQVKERDEKYADLDSKFNRLHKRAKQRIQEVQKEKEDLEAQFRDVSEKAERASSQLSALQQEMERTHQQANEALKAMDAERQQLRNANNKLRDNVEELRNSLEPKENALETLQHSLLEKEQILEDMQGLLQAADEKREASIAELNSKHQKQIESLEAQLADTLSDRNKATQAISSLQKMVADRESKIADMDAASSGEAARLRAAMETLKGELTQLIEKHEKEKENWEAAAQALNRKLEIAENNCIHAEIEAAKMKSQLELELSVQTQLLNTRDTDLRTAKEEIKRLESEFASYKVRAHALLQKKDADLAAARDNEQLRYHEEALREAEKEIVLASVERDKALQDLKEALDNHDKELSTRDAALSTVEQQIKNMETKLNSALSSHASEKDAWERNLKNVEETWRLRCEALKVQKGASSDEHLHNEIKGLKLQYKKLKEEHDSFRDLADKMIEEKDKEISRLLDDNKNLRQSPASRPPADNSDNNTANQRLDGPNLSTSAAEQQILILARQQAQREEELAQSQRHILVLQEEIEELERENRLHSQQEAMLKEEVRKMERMQKREGVDMTYLKNVIVKLLETGEVGALLPVVAMLLQFSPEEMQKCQQAYRASTEVPPSPEASGSGLSLFSRFSFS